MMRAERIPMNGKTAVWCFFRRSAAERQAMLSLFCLVYNASSREAPKWSRCKGKAAQKLASIGGVGTQLRF
jgi:hypothetical protein